MSMYQENAFVFSPSYRWLRHLIFWIIHILCFSFLFKIPDQSYAKMFVLSTLWVPAIILYAYPVAYIFISKYLLSEKYPLFILIILIWAIAGYFLNYFFRNWILFPVLDALDFKPNNRNPWAAGSYLTLNVMAGFTSMIVLFKHWAQKQKDFLTARNEQVSAELQLLKAQVHPHFLFNTLNNIYAFSLENSPKTPQLILKLSSLLSYMLYECKSPKVQLGKEIEVMKDYIGLEKERHGDRIDISLHITGEVGGNMIAPLLLLPFLENAFKHGISTAMEKSWLAMDLEVKNNYLFAKIVNSKNESTSENFAGIGINNVKKRLSILYPGKHELSLNDEGDFFSVALSLQLDPSPPASEYVTSSKPGLTLQL